VIALRPLSEKSAPIGVKSAISGTVLSSSAPPDQAEREVVGVRHRRHDVVIDDALKHEHVWGAPLPFKMREPYVGGRRLRSPTERATARVTSSALRAIGGYPMSTSASGE